MERIGWEQKPEGWRPINADGSPHRCTGRKAGRRTLAGDTITGANYKPSCGECAVPPWEPCACSS